MGAYKTKHKKQDVEKLERLNPEPDYEIKTRAPMTKNWTLNILRGKREDELRNECYPLVRRKCYQPVKALERCEKENGLFWTVFNCQEHKYTMQDCFDHELAVEMDKRRRNLTKNPEWWWRCLYDEDGEIGEQADWQGDWWLFMKFRELVSKYS